MMLRLLSINLLFLLSSCSYIVNNFDNDILKENSIDPIHPTQKTTCDIIQKNILISESAEAQNTFQSLVKEVTKSSYLSFIEQSVLWSLVQMNYRPDLSSPSAKLQVMLKNNGMTTYYNSYTTSGQGYPYIYLLEQLLKEYKSKKSIMSLAKIYDEKIKSNIIVNTELERFLAMNNDKIKSNKYLKARLMRGDETLRVGERLPKVNMTYLVRKYLKTKKSHRYKVRNFLFDTTSTTKKKLKCNFDMTLYNNSVFLIHSEKVTSNTWGIKKQNQVFFATSSQKLDGLKTIDRTILLRGNSNSRSPSMCIQENEKKEQVWLISSRSRDPGQHLHHLQQYGVADIDNLSELDTLLKFSRHQFLKDPVRLVIESRRSSDAQLSELLKLNIPIYNAKSLGKIWAYYENKKEFSFVLDERVPGYLECNSQ